MNPEARREHIFDCATALIAERGVANCTLEEVAARANISKALVYKHFANRDHLLTAILERERRIMHGSGYYEWPRGLSVAQIYQNTVPLRFAYLKERGDIMQALFADPQSADAVMGEDRDYRSSVRSYVVKKLVREYGIPESIAGFGAVLVMMAPNAGSHMLRDGDLELDTAIEVWVTFVLGGWAAIADKFGSGAPPAAQPAGSEAEATVKPAAPKPGAAPRRRSTKLSAKA